MQRIARQAPVADWALARACANADLGESHRRFVELFQRKLPHWCGERRVLDLGCGVADVAIRLAHAFPWFRIDGIEASYPMLAFGEQAVQVHGLRDRITIEQLHLPTPAFRPQPYDVVISEGMLHHLADPASMWRAVREATRVGSGVLVMDFLRPDSQDLARELGARHAGGDDEALQQDLYLSLLAAYTVEEVRAQLDASGLGMLEVEAVSDLHLLVSGDRLYRDDPLRPLWDAAPDVS